MKYSTTQVFQFDEIEKDIVALFIRDFFTARCIFFINDRCTRCSQARGTWDPRSMSEIIWFPGKPVLHSLPIGTKCLRTYVKRAQGWLTFISIPALNGSLCPLLYNRVSECRPFYFDSRSAPGGDRRGSSSIPHRSRAVGTCRRFCQRSPCTFSTLVLCPEEGKMKLLCFAARRFAAIVRIECISPGTKRFSLWE